ncbi:MAG: hypothetical protein P4L44_16840 [Oryzomonas sp.]|uniref:hypothetical protein n=1 Tax=Oryzomonas sp. TaxID=2855186 RepID=UPI00284CE7E2|nr:hypothetical protein [Oryzomonas sp.]MDR3581629.1 hypothetical protein [Oryzomonas sp.]
MLLLKSNCSHCGTPFAADDTADIYSIRVNSEGYLLEVMDGELVPGAFHYCSQDCMFKRDQGVTPEDTIFSYMGLACEAL